MPRVAIGVPVFNEQNYIAKTIASVIAQFEDCSDLEILISDNGSTDHSIREIEAVLDLFPKPSSAVRLSKHETNLGAHFNFWHVYDETDSDYFLWVGGHDQISRSYVSLGLRHLDQFPEVAMFCGKHQAIMPDDRVVEDPVEYKFSQEHPIERYLRSMATLVNCYIFHSMFRRSSLNGFDRENKAPSMDHVLISRWLWSGRLIQSSECSYLRRYFDEENSSEKIARGSYAHQSNNVQFYDAYLGDLEKLSLDMPEYLRSWARHKATDLLIQRFGIPFAKSR